MYLLTQLWLYLAAAFVSGGLLGYFVWSWCHRRMNAATFGAGEAGATDPLEHWRQRAQRAERQLSDAAQAHAEEIEVARSKAELLVADERGKRDAEIAASKLQHATVKETETPTEIPPPGAPETGGKAKRGRKKARKVQA